MRIHELRKGFATNSSSAHTWLLLPDGHDVHDHLMEEFNFGCDHFIAISPLAKKQYLAVTLARALATVPCSIEMKRAVVRQWIGADVVFDPLSYGNSLGVAGDVDDQSLPELPKDWYTQSPDWEFFKDFQDHVMQPNLAILGRNDNEGTEGYDPHPLEFKHSGARRVWIGAEGVARKDGTHWTVFDRKTGDKVRFSFNDKDLAPTKSTVPELVDVKITDHCPFGCTFCYQDSNADGKPADLRRLRILADALGRLRVFEVALGGGEPTLHPDFIKVLKAFHSNGVTPNFTTRNLAWLKDFNIVDSVAAFAGGFAFSVMGPDDVWRLVEALRPHAKDLLHPSIHYVLGTHPIEDLRYVLVQAYEHELPVTLLGYKQTGRGNTYNKFSDCNGWLTLAIQMHEEGKLPELNIDAALVQAYRAELEAAHLPDWCKTVREGAFSMYVDAVKWRAGASSYGDAHDMIGLVNAPSPDASIDERILWCHEEALAKQINLLFATF